MDRDFVDRSEMQLKRDDGVAVRELQMQDLDRGFLISLDNLIAGTSELEKTKAEELLREIKSNPLHRIFVAVSQGIIVGTTTLLVEPKFIFKGGRVGHIEDVSVRKGYEKMGIGHKLVRYATDIAREMGCVKIVLDCSDETMPFYEKLGYSYQDICMKRILKDKAQ